MRMGLDTLESITEVMTSIMEVRRRTRSGVCSLERVQKKEELGLQSTVSLPQSCRVTRDLLCWMIALSRFVEGNGFSFLLKIWEI